jgi:hypothetical protein
MKGDIGPLSVITILVPQHLLEKRGVRGGVKKK